MKPEMQLIEPDSQFTAQSEWDAFWLPHWYEQDQDLVVGLEKEYHFFMWIPYWIIKELARLNKPYPHLIFNNRKYFNNMPLIVMKGEVLQIRHHHYGSIKSIVNETFRMKMLLESGESILLNTEERTGAIWDEKNKKWLCQTQQGFGIWDDEEMKQIAKTNPFDWSMSVRFRVIDPDPYKIFSIAENPKPFCSDGSSPNVSDLSLHKAAQEGTPETVRSFLDTGIDVNIRNCFGDTPLFRAARSGHLDAVRILLEAGANPNLQNRTGWTPLHTASVQGHVEIVKILLETGAIVDPRNKNGWTPLFLAAGSGHLPVVQQLLNAGTDIEAEDANGNTPIYNAQKQGYQDIVQLLKQTKEKT
jgi:hypothetical protein